jgi:hypothetical protein
MARKIAELFGFYPGIQLFYAASCFDELSRGFVVCLLNVSIKTAVSQHHNSIFEPKWMTMASAGAIWGEHSPNGGVW